MSLPLEGGLGRGGAISVVWAQPTKLLGTNHGEVIDTEGIVAPLEALNVDTDHIIPKLFLKRWNARVWRILFFDCATWAMQDANPEFE